MNLPLGEGSHSKLSDLMSWFSGRGWKEAVNLLEEMELATTVGISGIGGATPNMDNSKPKHLHEDGPSFGTCLKVLNEEGLCVLSAPPPVSASSTPVQWIFGSLATSVVELSLELTHGQEK